MTAMAHSADEVMTVTASRLLADGEVCFVGIGLPSAAANLARQTHAPGLVLVYESGTIGTRPSVLPLSIGDEELAATADCIVSMPEVFSYWLQAGRVDVGFLGAAQIDRFGNLNTTVIGAYDHPKVRLPGSGGACEIAVHARRLFYVMRLSRRAFVETLDFVTSPGHLTGGDARAHLGLPGAGPELVITDKAVFNFDNPQREMQLVSLHPNVTTESVQAEVGWRLRLADTLATTPPPTEDELHLVRDVLDPQAMYR